MFKINSVFWVFSAKFGRIILSEKSFRRNILAEKYFGRVSPLSYNTTVVLLRAPHNVKQKIRAQKFEIFFNFLFIFFAKFVSLKPPPKLLISSFCTRERRNRDFVLQKNAIKYRRFITQKYGKQGNIRTQ